MTTVSIWWLTQKSTEFDCQTACVTQQQVEMNTSPKIAALLLTHQAKTCKKHKQWNRVSEDDYKFQGQRLGSQIKRVKPSCGWET